MKVADKLDELTQTFQKDQAFCEGLFTSRNAKMAAELFISHQWANAAFVICQKLLCGQAPNRFGEEWGKKAGLWTFVLSENLHRDMRLVSYLTFRGLLSEAPAILRRALEHAGVLAHLWREPAKLEAFEDPSSNKYALAFRRETDARVAKTLKDMGSSKRFAAMAAGQSATLLYERLSEFHIHGGTPTRIAFLRLDPGPNTCTFAFRPDPSDEELGGELELLRQVHQLLCVEVVSLCVNYCTLTEEFTEASQLLFSLVQTGDSRTPEMVAAVRQLLSRLHGEGTPSP